MAQERPDEEAGALRHLLDRQAIVDTITRMAILADARDWAELRTCFADDVDLDYTALAGGSPGRVADDLVAGWRATLSGFAATQHLVANHAVALAGDEATATASFQAQHYLPNETGGPLWTLAGTYAYRLRHEAGRWCIAALTMTPTWAAGNQHLLPLAARPSAGDESA